MRKFLLSAAALGLLVGGAEAAPFSGGRSLGVNTPTAVESVFWRRECNVYGRHCHLVWIRRHWR